MPLTLNGTTGIAGVDGSASTPANRGSDTNTGIVYGTDTVQIATGGATQITVDSSGNLGIGTTTPTYKFDVGNSSGQVICRINAGSTSTNDGAALYFGNSATYGNYGAIGAYSAILGGAFDRTFTVYSGLGLALAANGSERARIDTSGNLLVGTTSAINAGKLSISNGTNRAIVTAGSTGDVGSEAIRIQKFDNNTTTSQLFVRFTIANDGAGSGQINANGASSAAFGSYSDARLKENIVELTNQLANICALKPSEFDFKDGSGHQIGFIAQEMQEVYPDVVGEGDDGMLTITGWSKTEARLVKSIQELSAKLDAAEARLAALEAK